jgi:AraC-like DNA-binding protein
VREHVADNWICDLANAAQCLVCATPSSALTAIKRLEQTLATRVANVTQVDFLIARSITVASLANLIPLQDIHLLRKLCVARNCAELVAISHTLRAALPRDRSRENRSRHQLNPRLATALSYIEAHIYAGDELRLRDIAAASNLSPCHFDRLFCECMGVGVRSYIRMARLDAATLALRDLRKSVKEVCYGVAYKTHAAFARDFKRRFGMTPTQYRLSDDVTAAAVRDERRDCSRS